MRIAGIQQCRLGNTMGRIDLGQGLTTDLLNNQRDGREQRLPAKYTPKPMAPITAIVMISNPWRRSQGPNLNGVLILFLFPYPFLLPTSLSLACGECARLEKRGIASRLLACSSD